MGTTDWADIYTDIGADPDAAQQAISRARRASRRATGAGRARANPLVLGRPVRTSLWRQFSTVARRQVRLLVADRGYFVFLVLLPFIVGLLPLAVAGDTGFGKAAVDSAAPNEPKQILVLLNLGAIFMGTALTIRELVGERAIFRREQAAGLSTSAYLCGQGRRVRRGRGGSVGHPGADRDGAEDRQGRASGRGGAGQSEVGAVRRYRGDVCGGGDRRPVRVGAGAEQQSSAAADGGDADDAAGPRGRLHPGDETGRWTRSPGSRRRGGAWPQRRRRLI